MPVTDIGHTALACHDVDASLAFYANLGIAESFRLLRDDGSLILIYLHVGGDRFLELFPGGPAPGGEAAPTSFRHICLLTDDITSLVASLERDGVTIDRQVSTGLDHNQQAWLSDPDGNAIELMQISAESPQRATADGRPVQGTEPLKPA